uniref:Uncharacterized protein n=1 Tax=Gracilariopsis longissima TaxID=172976 RepID=A0A345U9S5_9FLOR|nr:hypothetical protein [Gracilariopsis longissima]AXI97211.1 hypothetical protein [Gracilariopsis longissima]UAD89127.1 hypothetical protein [Gracilariopsis longissima]
MYFYQRSNINYTQYYILNLRFDYVLIFCIFSYLIMNDQYIYFYYICNYKAFIRANAVSKYFLQIFIILIINLVSTLELNIINLQALSLYYWLGFSIINKRSSYYSSVNFVSSAYLLINVKSRSKNLLRRYLIINIDNSYF